MLTEPGEVKQRRWKQYFYTLYNDPNAVNIDYNEKPFSSHSNTRDDEEILNIDRGNIEKSKMQEGPRN